MAYVILLCISGGKLNMVQKELWSSSIEKFYVPIRKHAHFDRISVVILMKNIVLMVFLQIMTRQKIDGRNKIFNWPVKIFDESILTD